MHDLQTREKFYFICQNWLAVEKGDGKLERELFVACDPQKIELNFFLQKEAKHNLNDSHIWLSMFYRPVQSSFTRLDRVTCGFLLLYLSSLFNILYYGESNNSNSQNLFNFGPFSITLEQVIILILRESPFLYRDHDKPVSTYCIFGSSKSECSFKSIFPCNLTIEKLQNCLSILILFLIFLSH